MRPEQPGERGRPDNKPCPHRNREVVADLGSRKVRNQDGNLVIGTIFPLLFRGQGDRTVGFDVMAERSEDQGSFLSAMRKRWGSGAVAQREGQTAPSGPGQQTQAFYSIFQHIGEHKHKVTCSPLLQGGSSSLRFNGSRDYVSEFKGTAQMMHLTMVPDDFHLADLLPSFNRCSIIVCTGGS